MQTDRELIQVYLKDADDSEDAFRRFYWRHRQSLYVYILSIVRNCETAEEVLQETLMTFLRHVKNIESQSSFRPWLLRAARSRSIDRIRQENRESQATRKVALRAETKSIPDPADLAGSGLSDEVIRILVSLPVEQSEVLILRGFVEMTFAEIGELTGVTENTAISRYRYAVSKVRETMIQGGKGDYSDSSHSRG